MKDLARSPSKVGNKMGNLVTLGDAGVAVPRGFGVSFEAFQNQMKPLLPLITDLCDAKSDYADISNRIITAVTAGSLYCTSEILAAIDRHIPRAPFFAVRSSGLPIVNNSQLEEDSKEISLAGQFESFLMETHFLELKSHTAHVNQLCLGWFKEICIFLTKLAAKWLVKKLEQKILKSITLH
jgi:phosphoenolpyruvate synthase/pyruvate phosphate dikinase